MKNKFDILFEQIMNEYSLFDSWQKLNSIKTLDDYKSYLEKTEKTEKTPETIDSAELPVEGQDKVVEKFNKRLEALKTAISYPWLKEPYEGIYNELSKYNNEITKYKNDKQLLDQIGFTVFRVLGRNPENSDVRKNKQNNVSLSIWADCKKKLNKIKFEVKEYSYFKLSYLTVCLNTLFEETVSTAHINWFESCIENSKKLLLAINEKPVWFNLEKYIKKLDELKNKKDADENLVNTAEITDEIRDEYFIDYGYSNCWNQNIIDKFTIAKHLHNRDLKEHPELHNGLYRRKNGRCDETIYCSCGFEWSADSSD